MLKKDIEFSDNNVFMMCIKLNRINKKLLNEFFHSNSEEKIHEKFQIYHLKISFMDRF